MPCSVFKLFAVRIRIEGGSKAIHANGWYIPTLYTNAISLECYGLFDQRKTGVFAKHCM